MSFYKKSFESFADGVCVEDLIDYMEDHDLVCENEALIKMYEEYEISYYELRGDII